MKCEVESQDLTTSTLVHLEAEVPSRLTEAVTRTNISGRAQTYTLLINIIDQLCGSTSRWRELLKKTEEGDGPITKKYPEDIHVGWVENAWPIPDDLEK